MPRPRIAAVRAYAGENTRPIYAVLFCCGLLFIIDAAGMALDAITHLLGLFAPLLSLFNEMVKLAAVILGVFYLIRPAITFYGAVLRVKRRRLSTALLPVVPGLFTLLTAALIPGPLIQKLVGLVVTAALA